MDLANSDALQAQEGAVDALCMLDVQLRDALAAEAMVKAGLLPKLAEMLEGKELAPVAARDFSMLAAHKRFRSRVAVLPDVIARLVAMEAGPLAGGAGQGDSAAVLQSMANVKELRKRIEFERSRS